MNTEQTATSQGDVSPVRNSATTEERTPISTVSPANAVTLLSLQIPEFTGDQSENVKRWIQQVEHVARTHRATDEVTMLAASSKLTRTARKWYDAQTGAVLETWGGFSKNLVRMFERRVPFLVTMQKVEARKWIPVKELFQEYAIDKMALLELSQQDTINLLIGGVTSEALKAMAATIRTDNVEDFIDQMCRLAATVCCEEKQETTMSATQQGQKNSVRAKDRTCKNCGKKGHFHEECRSPQVICFYCKGIGHRSFECPKSKKRE